MFASKILLNMNKNIVKHIFQVIINLLVMSLLIGGKLLAKVMTLHVISIVVYGCMSNVSNVNNEYMNVLFTTYNAQTKLIH